MDQINQAYEGIKNWWYELHYSHIQKRALLILGALIIIFSSLFVVRGNTHEVVEPPIIAVQIAAPEIFIDVTGAVNKPGVYTLAANSRVIDAIKAAGNSAPGADLSTINLARVLSDGEQIYVDATVRNSSGTRVSKVVRSGPININRATSSQLDSLDGIGPVIARRIIEYRKSNGPFLTIEDLQKVSGIGVAKIRNDKKQSPRLTDYRALAIGAALWLGALLQSAIAPWRITYAAIFLALLSVFSRKLRFTVLITAILVGSTVMSLREASMQSSQIVKLYGQSSEIIAQVVTDPNQSASGNYTFIARAIYVKSSQGSFVLRTPIRVITPRPSVLELLPGQSFSAHARIVESKEGRVAALVLIDEEVTVITAASRWAKSLASIRLGLRNLTGDGNAGALIPGMVLGDTSKQSLEFKLAMRRSGLAHLVAVSGANFAIVSAFVLWCMQFLFTRMKFRLSATAIALICFIALVRPSPSVLRAAAMAAVLLIAVGTNRGRDSLPALGFAIGAVVVVDPWQARDAGFALSVLATAGLLLFAPKVAERLASFLPSKLAQALAPPIAAIVFCSPILVALSGYLSPISIVANLLAAPAVGPITILGFIAALLSPVAPIVSMALIWIIKFPAGFIATVANWAAQFPVLTLRTGSIGFLIVALFSLSLWLFKKYIKAVSVTALILIVALTWIQRWPAGDWQIANCDVGQGDSMVINLGNHRAIVIDVGPDPVVEDRCLKALGIDEIPLMILSHFHADHAAGLSGAIKNRRVAQLWVSTNAEPLMESEHVALLMKGVAIMRPQRGYSAQIAQFMINVLWPEIGEHDFASMPGDGSAVNNTSIAVLITSTDFSLFSAGDLEPPAQQELVRRVSEVDIYKVCHHGSRYQDEALMHALKPEIAVISVGVENRYGHPAPQTVQALTRLGAEVLRTDINGSISIQAKAHQFRIRTSKGRFNLFRLG